MIRRGCERGVFLVWAMLLVVLVGSLSAAALTRGRALRVETELSIDRLAAFHAAEGGIEYARQTLATDPDRREGTVEVGRFTVTWEAAPAADGWAVEARAAPTGVRARGYVER